MKLSIVTSADDNFAVPVTVMIRSVLDHFTSLEYLEVYILDCGLSRKSLKKIKKSFPRCWAHVNILPVDMSRFEGFRVDGHANSSAYARLLMEELLPSDIDKILYIDGDMLFLQNISELWKIDINGYCLAAVQDPVAGIFGASCQMSHWEGWDVPEGTKIFNSGLMLINLKECRKIHLFDEAMSVARKNPERMKFWDQCALNYIIRGQYLPLSPYWNVLPQFYYEPECHNVLYDKDIVKGCINHPKALHFSGGYRPWKGPGRHWRETEFYRYLYRTAWKDSVYCAPWMGEKYSAWTRLRRSIKYYVLKKDLK